MGKQPSAHLEDTAKAGATGCTTVAGGSPRDASAPAPLALQKGVNCGAPQMQTDAAEGDHNRLDAGREHCWASERAFTGPACDANHGERPPLPPENMQKGVNCSNHQRTTGNASMNASTAAAETEHRENESEVDTLSAADGNAACEECGRGADCKWGCKLTCSLVDQPHPTRRKYVAKSALEDWQRWAYTRGSGDRVRTASDMRGIAGLTRQALARANMMAFSCPACAGLTDLGAARRAAGRQGRQRLLSTDSCYGCGPNMRPGKLSKAQRGKAQAVLRGAKIVILQPEWANQREGLMMLSGQEAHQAVGRAIASLPAHL